MEEDRPAKQAIRNLWIDLVYEQRAFSGAAPLYLTMPGAVGREIDLLIERGLLRQLETGAIDDADAKRVVVVESSPNAMAELKKRFPGISALGDSVHGLLKGSDRTKMPEGIHRTRCQAKVVNLDFNKPLQAKTHQGVPAWDELELVVKLAMLHRATPESWFLCLTVNADMPWAQAVQRAAVRFVRENIERRAGFRADCERVLGVDLVTFVENSSDLVADQDARDRQRFLMAFVPKKIASEATPAGWRLSTLENIHYGGTSGHAPMVTWIFRFDWNQRTGSTPDQVYGEAVDSSLANCCELSEDGQRSAIE